MGINSSSIVPGPDTIRNPLRESKIQLIELLSNMHRRIADTLYIFNYNFGTIWS